MHDLQCDQGQEEFWESDGSYMMFKAPFWMRFRPLDYGKILFILEAIKMEKDNQKPSMRIQRIFRGCGSG